MMNPFSVVAEPTRRRILDLLREDQRSVGELVRTLRISQPAVSKHLRVLKSARLVEARVDAQRRLYRLRPDGLREVDAWILPFRRFWSGRLDALERRLDETAPVAGTDGAAEHASPQRRRRP